MFSYGQFGVRRLRRNQLSALGDEMFGKGRSDSPSHSVTEWGTGTRRESPLEIRNRHPSAHYIVTYTVIYSPKRRSACSTAARADISSLESRHRLAST